jgi:serine kinase of HPr protein (carbohydrate metabolism regulator)
MIADEPAETVHATTVALDGRAVLISGPSGAGKSDLALRLLDRGFMLVSDDRTLLRRNATRVHASAPATIAGKLEVRGIGIVELPTVSDAPVCLAVELAQEIERLPDEGCRRELLGLDVPLVRIDARAASAPAKVSLALDRLGLRA